MQLSVVFSGFKNYTFKTFHRNFGLTRHHFTGIHTYFILQFVKCIKMSLTLALHFISETLPLEREPTGVNSKMTHLSDVFSPESLHSQLLHQRILMCGTGCHFLKRRPKLVANNRDLLDKYFELLFPKQQIFADKFEAVNMRAKHGSPGKRLHSKRHELSALGHDISVAKLELMARKHDVAALSPRLSTMKKQLDGAIVELGRLNPQQFLIDKTRCRTRTDRCEYRHRKCVVRTAESVLTKAVATERSTKMDSFGVVIPAWCSTNALQSHLDSVKTELSERSHQLATRHAELSDIAQELTVILQDVSSKKLEYLSTKQQFLLAVLKTELTETRNELTKVFIVNQSPNFRGSMM